MGFIWTLILLIVALVVGIFVGRLLKMSFGCKEEDTSDTGASVTASAADSSVAENTADSGAQEAATSAAPAASLVSSNAKTSTPAKTEPAKAAPAKKATTKSAAKTTTTAAKTSATTAKKSAPAAKATSAVAAKAGDVKDNLTKIKGVGKLNEQRLQEEGITTFAQIAAWKKKDINVFDEKLNFKGRIEREEWVPQAKLLAKETAKPAAAKAPAKTAAAKAPAKAAPVKAAASKPAAKKPAAKKPAVKKPAAPKAPDDLKLLKGVGKTIETKLAKEGITSFAQIAKWKKADIEEFDEKLSFKGRIERDEWISQAKILAKGGTTEFSKRAAKGDVPSSS